jgi:PAS domain S-box-containing protein
LMYHFDLDDQLDQYAREAEDLVAGAPAMFTIPQFYLYFALSKLRLIGESSAKDHLETMNLVDRYLQLVEIWSQSAPTSFHHKYHLIAAERARVTGNLEGALSHYEQAIKGARASGFTHEEALANELYGRFWIERDNARFAAPLMDEAHGLYRKWGAMAKAEHLAIRYPEWMTKEQVPTAIETALSDERIADHLDLHTMLKASQEIAGDLELESLLAKMMGLVIKNAGAEKGLLIMEEEGQWRIVAEGDVESKATLVQEPQDLGASEVVSQGIVNYVIRTRKSVVLTDAAHDGDFTHDPTIQHRQSKSVLCTPLINQRRLSGILYLENHLAAGAFTFQRVELLNLLSSQMALALDNATLYSSLETRLAELSESEAKFRNLVDNSLVGVFNSTLDGQFLFVNEALVRMYDYDSAEQMVAEGALSRWVDPKRREQLISDLQEHGGVSNFEAETITATGHHVHVLFSVKLQDEIIAGMVMDVTERRQAEGQVRAHQERLRAMASELVFTEERERKRISSDLHDGAVQSLAVARLKLAEVGESIVGSAVEGLLDDASQMVRHSLEQIRGVLLDLSSPSLREIGLEAALSEWLDDLGKKHDIRTEFIDECGDVFLTNDVRVMLFRNARELMANTIKHGRAKRISVRLACSERALRLTVEDDGVGFDPEADHRTPSKEGAFGLFSIREHMVDLGGALDIVSAPGEGCKATLIAPLWSGVERRQR